MPSQEDLERLVSDRFEGARKKVQAYFEELTQEVERSIVEIREKTLKSSSQILS